MINLKTQNWIIENIDTVLFDKDGTFIDLHYFWGQMTELRANEIINKFNLSNDMFKMLCEYLGYDVVSKKMRKDGITALYSRSKIIEIFNEDLKKHNIKTTYEEIEKIFDIVNEKFYKEMDKYTKPIESCIEFIKQLKTHNIKIGIVTSDSQDSTQRTIKSFGWENYFDVVIGRETTPYTKESGKPTQLALELLKSNPQNTVMIGDAPMDYISAKNANIEKTILVATGQIDVDELQTITLYTVNSMREVIICNC